MASGPWKQLPPTSGGLHVCFFFKAGADCEEAAAPVRSVLPSVMEAAVKMAKGGAEDTVPGATVSGIMHDLKTEFNDMLRRDTRDRFKLREFVPPAKGSQVRFRPSGHIGFSGVVPLQYSGAMEAYEERCRLEEEAEAAARAGEASGSTESLE
ncbi:hypothetical protein BOTBODRAFT_70157 [Botryobasidium botryosum FD-172 SS1]|uniref:Uncharacterized protein n=1 Tax=Botryobasidium botryosum (strain FD-172 SS1) TaxID=930990 RepID=A0A067LWT7_BOTB1|nr:hypothetical protein BOTBODRAFT_70157 [Botryobasidium botryosum FD-172 SS1]